MRLLDPIVLFRLLNEGSATIELIAGDKFKITQPVTEEATGKVLEPVEMIFSRAAFEEEKAKRLGRIEVLKTQTIANYDNVMTLFPTTIP